MAEEYRGIPPDEITTHNNTRREEQSWANAPHEDLVRAFRGLIQEERQALGKDAWLKPPVAVVSNALAREATRGYPENAHQMYLAWGVIAYDSFQFEQRKLPESEDIRYDIGYTLWGAYKIARDRQEPRPELIRLDPLQVKVLDALEAVLKILSQSFQPDMGCFGLCHSVNFHRQYRINPGYDDNHIYLHEYNGKRVVP